MIRLGTKDDISSMQEIEVSAGSMFAAIGMHAVAEDPPFSRDVLAGYIAGGRAWVALVEGEPAGYVVIDVVDGRAHIEQLSVDPAHQRKGIGRQLVERVAMWAAASDLDAITLTTFRDVPWNGPYYERLGFRAVALGNLSSGLVALREREAADGLDPALRVCMVRPV